MKALTNLPEFAEAKLQVPGAAPRRAAPVFAHGHPFKNPPRAHLVVPALIILCDLLCILALAGGVILWWVVSKP